MFAHTIQAFRHWFVPHSGNNFRARLLHNSGIFAILGIFLAISLFVRLLDSPSLHILGFTSSVNIDEVVRLTNERRLAAGLTPLTYNESLADAARRKANNMLTENYWAHNSPSGISPWYWFGQAGYSYIHAGENLAKDFGSTDRMMSAWMDSPTHRDNILSSQYQEIGLAVVPGTLLGQETVLVVQLFGTRQGGAIPTISQVSPETQGVKTIADPALNQATNGTPPAAGQNDPTTTPAEDPELALSEAAVPVEWAEGSTLTNEFSVKQTLAIITTLLLLLALVTDLILAESQVLSRRVGKNWAHIIFINVILILVTIVQAGRIL